MVCRVGESNYPDFQLRIKEKIAQKTKSSPATTDVICIELPPNKNSPSHVLLSGEHRWRRLDSIEQAFRHRFPGTGGSIYYSLVDEKLHILSHIGGIAVETPGSQHRHSNR